MGVSALLDPRPGGAFRVEPNGRDVVLGEYIEVEPPHRVVFTWGFERSRPPRAGRFLARGGDARARRRGHAPDPAAPRAARARSRPARRRLGPLPGPPRAASPPAARQSPTRGSSPTERTTHAGHPLPHHRRRRARERLRGPRDAGRPRGQLDRPLEVPEETGAVARLASAPTGPRRSKCASTRSSPPAAWSGRRLAASRAGSAPRSGGSSRPPTTVAPSCTSSRRLARAGRRQRDGHVRYTWAMIIEGRGNRVARGERAPYFTADAPLPN